MPWTALGQDRALALLRDSLENPAHAYLLVGPEGSGKALLAREFARALLCSDRDVPGGPPCGDCTSCRRTISGNHPDLAEYQPKGRMGYREEDTEGIPATAAVSPFEARYKVFLLERVDALNRWAANSLLKVLEEPPATVVFVLLSARPEKVMETIASRCRVVHLQPLSSQAIATALR
ncbi:MAG: AAA family ATPase [Dehalococcoidia bacterium]|nr:AAA family ATPase [Dehalococcoidia bacterium]